uniref:ATP synthase F0 subunit 6 n=1 Tax=Docophoroides brevis TaxID=160119 RepID=UPI00211F1FF9|nr:ATP synthase F0 subunit 6 [Docophoroides brevis]UTT72584.1 ATP synthase F0 subunit 6 [Docophoroides brevis]
MLCSLLSIFDPSCYFMGMNLQLKWVSMGSILLFVMWQFNSSSSGIILLLQTLSKLINEMMKMSFSSQYKSVNLMMLSLFILFMIVGESGMVPMMFTPSSHMLFNISLAIPMWLGGFLYMCISSIEGTMSHLVPLGSPNVLAPFLVLIETVSLLIRPFSLSIRMMSNMMAGHMIMVLIASPVSINSSFYMVISIVTIQCGLTLFEMCVAIVQAYVFMNLMSLYLKENNEV